MQILASFNQPVLSAVTEYFIRVYLLHASRSHPKPQLTSGLWRWCTAYSIVDPAWKARCDDGQKPWSHCCWHCPSESLSPGQALSRERCRTCPLASITQVCGIGVKRSRLPEQPKGLSDGRACSRCWTVGGVLPTACFVSLGEESWDILDGFISIESLWIQVLFGFWMSIVTPACLSQSLSLPLPQLHVFHLPLHHVHGAGVWWADALSLVLIFVIS